MGVRPAVVLALLSWVVADVQAGRPDLNALADWIASAPVAETKKGGYDPVQQLIGGNFVGGCGYQLYAYGVVNPATHCAYALEPYHPAVAAALHGRVDYFMGRVGYTGGERHESLWGAPILFPPYNNADVTLEGAPPPGDCAYDTSHWILAHLPDTPNAGYEGNLNFLVPALLYHYDWGEIAEAQRLFDVALGYWDGQGFRDLGAVDNFASRDLAFFLIARRATGFYVDPALVDAIEGKLAYLQSACWPRFGGGLPTAYQLNGDRLPAYGHSSAELNGLTLLAFDGRLAVWHPNPVHRKIVRTGDTHVRENSPDSNYGTADFLRVRGSGSGKQAVAFLTFAVSGYGAVYEAVVKLHTRDLPLEDATVHAVADASWDENALTYARYPAVGPPLATLTNLAADSYHEFDVSGYITGNGTYAFAVTTTQDAGFLDFDSKEGTNPPRLRLNRAEDNAGFLEGDIDSNGAVDWKDLITLADQWLDIPGGADLNLDGRVDFRDLGLVVAQWLVTSN